MRFFLDHDVPAEAAQLLRHWGHEVTLLKEALPITAVDEEAFGYARQQGLIAISCNRAHFMALAEQAIRTAVPFPASPPLASGGMCSLVAAFAPGW